MTSLNNTKKPFGLTVAVKVAQEAIKNNIAPSSVVLNNLFFLQKSTAFPKDLDQHFFASPKQQSNELEKKIIIKLLDAMKHPQVNLQELLETAFGEGWIKKIAPKPVVKATQAKPKTKKKPVKSATVKKTTAAPTIIVKKSKIN
jgi:hypothetical protein